jgi:hypothetical protein
MIGTRSLDMTFTYHPAITDPVVNAQLGPTECGVGCGRLLTSDEPWVTHDGVVEHVDCHDREHTVA